MIHETQVIVLHHGMKTRERDERRDEAELFISFECFQTMMKHVERVFHMAFQTHGETGG